MLLWSINLLNHLLELIEPFMQTSTESLIVLPPVNNSRDVLTKYTSINNKKERIFENDLVQFSSRFSQNCSFFGLRISY